MSGFTITREYVDAYLKRKAAAAKHGTTPPKEEKTTDPHEITLEDVEKYAGQSAAFPPGFQFTRYDAPLNPDSGVRIIDEDMTIEEELKAMGYSGYYKEMHDGPISRIIPLDKYGNREDIE